ncbi:MAG: bifunctional aspartate kinase/homoserine dehydrogenase I [Bacteroidetes bacterium GWF2_42_66]|nr:MAG: bifunctional aspartate kinase/homoserine dehydrogenase I [Bacteroidetes bacterium GWA2_42_15]OFY01191.1 MAG: bifunctional aspartate kinase/homoserine dehydrogenase I [Bacteroidetes bacterium GWE2_42_39]OFY42034.1 MAG: bifunctional aspartate kinase/homoserine dehydrogenase I [Bacteroidetes bacterium GWF2_42_66]HBL77764.1 bifunctional aspartate kinase/homoserine dehydrogenase I [Prolixibacteraceae bacterium]HCB62893.1 bifunctional aspartate kinase/homoserine dehydrogenase I [Bacteroidales
MKVLKFGGTSVGNAENIRKVRNICSKQDDDIIVVVSALGGITDKILNAARMAALDTGYFNVEITAIKERHFELIDDLFGEENNIPLEERVTDLLDELEKIIRGISMIGELTPKTLDKIGGFGERLSSLIISEFIPGAQWFDSCNFIRTDSHFGKARVNFDVTNRLIKKTFSNFSGLAVVPGFIASNEAGEMTTLGRGGSDYTGSILAAALDASALEIWTDVNGFMTADPRVISKAYTIRTLSYSEAMELSHFGAKVIYPPTILPVYQKEIPVKIKNTMEPEAEGTLITGSNPNGKDLPIKGISSISDITLVTVQGLGMVGVTGISMRLFGALAKEDINVILISQASSENSISFAINTGSAEKAEMAIRDEFEREIATQQINKITVESNLSIVAIVGENMKHTTGIAGKLFHTIGKNGINIIAIAQGASELNISWVVKDSDLRKTLNVVHESFFLSENIELNIFLLGIGLVGGNLLKQIHLQQPKLLKEKHLKIKLAGVANSKKMLLSRDGIDIANYKERMLSEGETSNIEGFKNEIIGLNMYNSIFVDCTANTEVADIYHELLNANVSIVTANKVAASSEYSNYVSLKKTAKRKGVKFLFETNVGAGLPIINTLNDMVNSGDKILRIEAVLSGTLNFIFNTISEKIPFSQTIRMAKEQGYSEPDPRIDLSGMDVVRKLLILVRESGYVIDKEDVTINKFIPDNYFEGSADDFWKLVPGIDAEFEQKRKKLVSANKCWRFVARFEEGKAEVGLQEIEQGHPFFDLQGSNNLVMFTTERYHEFPMIIKGYGAGADVTAAGVFADIIRVSNI